MRTVLHRYKIFKKNVPNILQTDLPIPYEFHLQCQLTHPNMVDINRDSQSNGIFLNRFDLTNCPGYYMLHMIHTSIPAQNNQRFYLHRSRTSGDSLWIFGHKNIKGNEIVDKAPKNAIQNQEVIHFKSHWYQAFSAQLLNHKSNWHEEHTQQLDTKGTQYKNKISFTNLNNLKKMYTQLNKAQLTIYLRILINSHCTPDKLINKNL
ncbi:hypothetical protein TSAR_016939 [Trichomalopsis sarcophagae]|uniref:Uncharacterized protein n=1 Tax=Trichomalopsis sarcophagae TaxID=543379 RepID=A0A232EHD5_9HYME|nr:hypothetical protein TSAR_016939 [Trichomalopsis sarcophagae]